MMVFQRVNGFICYGKLEHGNNPWDLTNSTRFDIVGYWSKLNDHHFGCTAKFTIGSRFNEEWWITHEHLKGYSVQTIAFDSPNRNRAYC